jgi:hypothetical protein
VEENEMEEGHRSRQMDWYVSIRWEKGEGRGREKGKGDATKLH